MFNSSLQRKILGMVISLVFLIIASMLGLFIFTDYKREFDGWSERNLQLARMLSYMDPVQDAIVYKKEEDLLPLINYYQTQTNASFILIKDKNGKILAHPNSEEIGKIQSHRDTYKAIVFGGYYSMISSDTIEKSIVGIAPIYEDEKRVIGTVTVGYLVAELNDSIMERVKGLLYISLFIFGIGILSSYGLSNSIRKDTLGLEPSRMTALYLERNAILTSIGEGIIAINGQGIITLMNPAAKNILHLSHNYISYPLSAVIPEFDVMEKYRNSLQETSTFEVMVKNKILIMNVVPLWENIRHVGTVITFKDKTEMENILDTLYEVRKYSDDLRAQTHEFTNKLYVVSGLLQLKQYDKAMKMIQGEIDSNEYTNRIVFEHIKDADVQAILLGKIGKASERKLNFGIDENSSLNELPSFITTASLTVMIGNLIDNAFDAVSTKQGGKVNFFALDIGDDIIFEVMDNGPGIEPEQLDAIFEQGFSTKQESGRGFGLMNVRRAAMEVGGDVQVSSDKQTTTFSVYIPKKAALRES